MLFAERGLVLPCNVQKAMNIQTESAMSEVQPTTTTTTSGKPRKKTSAACTSCRTRRTKCFLEPGKYVCRFCERNELECIFQYDDERKKPSSKAYIASLNERVQMLEELLTRQNDFSVSPTANSVAQDTNAELSNKNTPPATLPLEQPTVAPAKSPLAIVPMRTPKQLSDASIHAPSQASSAGSFPATQTRKSLVSHFVDTVDSLWQGEVVNNTEEAPTHQTLVIESRGRQKQIDRLFEDISSETDEYLLYLFFEHGNSMLPVIHKEAFYHDKTMGRSQWYSGFLHICILAMGLRYAERGRPDIRRLILPNRESTLHRGAKYMVEYELQASGGIPSVQALLLLGDLEAACGRDNTGWMYGGMVLRLCFDVGLHIPPKDKLAPWEKKAWRRALWACYLHDKYWAFYLARPASVKNSDIAPIVKEEEASDLQEVLFMELVTLMEIITTITDNVRESLEAPDDIAYAHLNCIHRRLKKWYTNLPEALRWTEQNIRKAPLSFFLLHQQYYSNLILLHRPFCDVASTDDDDQTMEQMSTISRAVCLDSAMKVAHIFSQHRSRFDIKFIYFSAVQHAGTASTALISAVTLISDPEDRVEPLRLLCTLARALHDMASVYQPAARMSVVLDRVLYRAGWNIPDTPVDENRALPRKRTIPPSDAPEFPPPKRSREPRSSALPVDPNNKQLFAPFFDPVLENMNNSQMNPHIDSSFSINNQALQDVHLNIQSDDHDLSWTNRADTQPLIPDRAGFLDLSSGFDRLLN